MSPHRCHGCALQESRDGRVCPAAREVHGLPDVVAQRHAAVLRAAVLADAGRLLGFAELVRREVEHRHRELLAAAQAALPAGPVPSPAHEPRKEVPCRLPM